MVYHGLVVTSRHFLKKWIALKYHIPNKQNWIILARLLFHDYVILYYKLKRPNNPIKSNISDDKRRLKIIQFSVHFGRILIRLICTLVWRAPWKINPGYISSLTYLIKSFAKKRQTSGVFLQPSKTDSQLLRQEFVKESQ